MKHLILTLFLLSPLAHSQFHHLASENVACQLPSVPTQEFNNFNNLLDLFETRVKTYHYSKKNQTLFQQGRGRKYYAWKNFDGHGSVLQVMVDIYGRTQVSVGKKQRNGRYLWQPKKDWQVVLDSSNFQGQFRHVVKSGFLFRCSMKGLSNCHRVKSNALLANNNFHLAIPGGKYDRKGIVLKKKNKKRKTQPVVKRPILQQYTSPFSRPITNQNIQRHPIRGQSIQQHTQRRPQRPIVIAPQRRPIQQSQQRPQQQVQRQTRSQNPFPQLLNQISWAQLEEMNLARTKPHHYADLLEQDLRTGRVPGWMTTDYKITIDVLRKRKSSLAPLQPSATLTRKAQDWSVNQSRRNVLEHSNDSHGTTWAENVTQMGDNPRFAIIGYIGESRNVLPGIGHRLNIFNPKFKYVGVGTNGRYSTQQFSNRP